MCENPGAEVNNCLIEIIASNNIRILYILSSLNFDQAMNFGIELKFCFFIFNFSCNLSFGVCTNNKTFLVIVSTEE